MEPELNEELQPVEESSDIDCLIGLNAILRLHESNFLNLHWNCVGEEFNDVHKGITTDHYELCNKYVDVTAEMIARLDGYPLNFVEVAQYAEDNDLYVAPSETLYSRKDVIDISDDILAEVCEAIKDCLDSEVMADTANAGIKSELESMLEDFDIQYRYINKRKLVTV